MLSLYFWLIIPFLNPWIYIAVNATGTVRKMLSSLIQVANISANAIEIILILFFDIDNINSDNKYIDAAIDKVSVWTYLGQATNKGDNASINNKYKIIFLFLVNT